MSVQPSAPERVAVETLRGNIRAGRVVGEVVTADTDGLHRQFRVDVDGTIWRVDENDVPDP